MYSVALIADICSMSVSMLQNEHNKKIDVHMLKSQRHSMVNFVINARQKIFLFANWNGAGTDISRIRIHMSYFRSAC